jgi:hypothetical protein
LLPPPPAAQPVPRLLAVVWLGRLPVASPFAAGALLSARLSLPFWKSCVRPTENPPLEPLEQPVLLLLLLVLLVPLGRGVRREGQGGAGRGGPLTCSDLKD